MAERDVLERLGRCRRALGNLGMAPAVAVLCEASDEIRRLREELATTRKALLAYSKWADEGADLSWRPQGHRGAVEETRASKKKHYRSLSREFDRQTAVIVICGFVAIVILILI